MGVGEGPIGIGCDIPAADIAIVISGDVGSTDCDARDGIGESLSIIFMIVVKGLSCPSTPTLFNIDSAAVNSSSVSTSSSSII